MTRYREKCWYLIAGEDNIWGLDHGGPPYVFFRVCKILSLFDGEVFTHWGWYYYGLGREEEYIIHGLFDSRPEAQEAAESYFYTHVERRDE